MENDKERDYKWEAESGPECTTGEGQLNMSERKRSMRRKVYLLDVGTNFDMLKCARCIPVWSCIVEIMSAHLTFFPSRTLYVKARDANLWFIQSPQTS